MKRLIAGTGIAAVLLTGAGVASAQTGEPGSEQGTEQGGREGDPRSGTDVRPHRHGFGGLRGFAEELGLEPAELAEELAAGRTIAEIAEEQGVDIDAVIQAMLDETEERLRELATRTFDSEVLERPASRRGPGPHSDGPPPEGGGDDRPSDGPSREGGGDDEPAPTST